MLFLLLLLLTFIGDEQCLSCHEKQRTYLSTAHHLTSREANATSIFGSVAPGKNVLTAQRELHYRMEARGNGFFQVGILGTPPDTVSLEERFDLVIGSGGGGKKNIYFGKKDQSFQIPVFF